MGYHTGRTRHFTRPAVWYCYASTTMIPATLVGLRAGPSLASSHSSKGDFRVMRHTLLNITSTLNDYSTGNILFVKNATSVLFFAFSFFMI